MPSKSYTLTYEEVMDLFTDECIDNVPYSAKDGIEYTVKYLDRREKALETLTGCVDAYALHDQHGIRIQIPWRIKNDLKDYIRSYTFKQIKAIMKRLDLAHQEGRPITEGLYRIEEKGYDRSEQKQT